MLFTSEMTFPLRSGHSGVLQFAAATEFDNIESARFLRVSVKVENQPLLVTEQKGRGGGVHDCEKVLQTKFAEIRVFFSRNITDILHRLKTIFRRNAEIFCRLKRNFR